MGRWRVSPLRATVRRWRGLRMCVDVRAHKNSFGEGRGDQPAGGKDGRVRMYIGTHLPTVPKF